MRLVQLTQNETVNLDNCLGWAWEPEVNGGRFRFIGASGGIVSVKFFDLVPSRCNDTFRLGRGIIQHEDKQPIIYHAEMTDISRRVLCSLNDWLVSPNDNSFDFAGKFSELFLQWSDLMGIPRGSFQ